MLAINTIAPSFKLYATPDQQVELTQLLGRKVILAFYPADWSPVCGDQMVLLNETVKFFQQYNAIVMGISVDGKWSHMAFSKDRNLHFPLLADFEPKGLVSKRYDVYDDSEGESKRALYIIDEKGIIRWHYLSPVGINPGVDGILQALDEMK
ncbi:MAG: redoxin domain-containing protein [Chitinophagaceae bacterium]